MNSRLKGIVTVILIVIIGLVAVSGIGYIRQRMAADHAQRRRRLHGLARSHRMARRMQAFLVRAKPLQKNERLKR